MRGEAAADDGPEAHHRPRPVDRQGPPRRGGGLPARPRARIRAYRSRPSTAPSSCSRPTASWSGTISAPAAGATRRRRGRHHDHLIDLESGRVIEFRNEEIERLQERVARELGFNLVGHKLELYGVPTRGQAPAQMTMTATEEDLRQDVWLPDERLRLRAHDGAARRRTAMPRPTAMEDGRRHPPQHLPHPREGRREGLFRPRPHPPGEGRARQRGQGHDRRGGRLRRPGRGRRDRAPRAGRRSGGRSAELPPAGRARSPAPAARARARSSRPAFPRRTSSAGCPSARRPRR